jgi:ATP-dependent Clp protease ATP-binding subunit ClpA
VRLLRRRSGPRAESFRPAERYLIAAAADARRLGHGHIGTEHLLLGLLRTDPNAATRLLRRLGVEPAVVSDALQCWVETGEPTIDPDALARLGIDYHAVVGHLAETFGAGALERTRAACLGVRPRAKLALAFAVDYADGDTVFEDHLLLGMVRVPDSVAGRVLAEHGVTLEAAEASRSAPGDNL